MKETFIDEQLVAYCKATGCKGITGTFSQNEHGIFITVHSSSTPNPERFTKIKKNRNNAYICFIAAEDFYNNEVTGGIEPFVKQIES